VEALRDGVPAPGDLIPLGAVPFGRRSARTGPDGIVHHNSVGLGVQDAAAARAVVDAAQKERP
ncbi:ornithine cyclodeaminase family protein, partial [Streptomyces sp. W16]|nr:ornithine cyclodeaminase family protein [Streptomyces sp. W16]